MDKDNNQLKKLKLTGITALKYKRYNIILHRPLHEGRERIKIRISVFLVTHPLVSKISLATRTLLLDKTLFFRPDDLEIAFNLPERRIKQTNYVSY